MSDLLFTSICVLDSNCFLGTTSGFLLRIGLNDLVTQTCNDPLLTSFVASKHTKLSSTVSHITASNSFLAIALTTSCVVLTHDLVVRFYIISPTVIDTPSTISVLHSHNNLLFIGYKEKAPTSNFRIYNTETQEDIQLSLPFTPTSMTTWHSDDVIQSFLIGTEEGILIVVTETGEIKAQLNILDHNQPILSLSRNQSNLIAMFTPFHIHLMDQTLAQNFVESQDTSPSNLIEQTTTIGNFIPRTSCALLGSDLPTPSSGVFLFAVSGLSNSIILISKEKAKAIKLEHRFPSFLDGFRDLFVVANGSLLYLFDFLGFQSSKVKIVIK
ncbi:hypothetical protein RCL1_007495 [Eukaryota sp. TZLM3-RCL]